MKQLRNLLGLAIMICSGLSAAMNFISILYRAWPSIFEVTYLQPLGRLGLWWDQFTFNITNFIATLFGGVASPGSIPGDILGLALSVILFRFSFLQLKKVLEVPDDPSGLGFLWRRITGGDLRTKGQRRAANLVIFFQRGNLGIVFVSNFTSLDTDKAFWVGAFTGVGLSAATAAAATLIYDRAFVRSLQVPIVIALLLVPISYLLVTFGLI